MGRSFFVAGVLGLGAVISETGLGTAVVHLLSAHVDFSAGHPFWNVTLLSAISTFVAIVTNLPGVPAVMTPVAQDFAHMAGLSLTAVLMTQVIAFFKCVFTLSICAIINGDTDGKITSKSGGPTVHFLVCGDNFSPFPHRFTLVAVTGHHIIPSDSIIMINSP
ncbi:hypothetical protein P4S72_24950 [Vibrio sp. PP-XX7]